MACTEDITVRPCKPGEAKYLMEFAEKNEWDLTMYDYESYMRFDPNFMLVAVDKSETPVGFAGLSRHAPGVVYFGNFIVREDLRGKGIGRLLWKASLERAGNDNIVLDGGPEMADWYKAHGFPHHTFKVFFHKVIVTEEMKADVQSRYEVVDLTESMWPELMEYDKLVYPNFNREKFLRGWFTGTDDVRVVVAKDAGKIVGYGSIHKKPKQEYGMRNVFADDENVLEAMMRRMFENLPVGTVIHFMLVGGKPLPKYIKHSIQKHETAERMFSKEEIKTNTGRMWFATAHIV